MSEAKPSIRIMGKKVGMTRVFDAEGNLVVCTVITAEPNVVTQVKTPETDGYTAIQMAADRLSSAKKKRLSKAMQKAYEKKNIDPRRTQFESRVDTAEGVEMGAEFGVDLFEEGQFLDVTAVTKGKGYQGVMKKYNYKGGPAAHGSGFHRLAGSTGMRSTPGRTLPGTKMSGQMGNYQQTTQNLRVVKVDADKQLLLVKGAVPGHRGSNVWMQKAVKKTK